ncbi:BppU family phage baseplate upper protein [Staphylococcus haemolyticus]|uniref:BppU family phage baseplate upper protein n=1 Tax=Staphylococcus haemolyticus TaxID=1283 RepID=UPI000BA6A445|nr:BppU family phage baseplate upper protein [Staphylococcus haemolyticus]PAK69917.1 hypothetical protein B8W97_07505 [Staphylococcus haemolyticus]
MIYKNKDIVTNINERGIDLGNINVTFYTLDNGTTSLRIFLKKEVNYDNQIVKDPVDLTIENWTPYLLMVAEDGSIFYENLDIVDAKNGIVQYLVSNVVVRHVGKIEASIILENKEDSVHVANFYFNVADSGLSGSIGKEVDVYMLEDIVAKVMSKNAMGLLSEEYREQLRKEIIDYLKVNKKEYQMRYEDLTYSQKQDLMKELADQTRTDFQIEDNSLPSSKLIDKTLTTAKFADQYSAVRVLDDGENVTTLNKEGIYFKTPTTRLNGMPNQLKDNGYGFGGIVVVKPYSQFHYVQTIYDVDNKGVFYNRTVKNNANAEWRAYSSDEKVTQLANEQANIKMQNILNVFEKYSETIVPDDVMKNASAIQEFKVEGINPSTPVKIWFACRNFGTWNYRIMLGQKVNGTWSLLLDTGTNFTVKEAEKGATDISFEKNGIKLKARINYNLIANGDRYIDQRNITDEPYFILRPSKVNLLNTQNNEGNGSGVAYDQSLNTTDSVKFASIKTDALDVSGTMPSGTLTQPPKVSKGDMWLDTTDSATHPIVRVMS